MIQPTWPISQVWQPWEPIHVRLEQILLSWEGTPYLKGQRQKGVGVDCVRFVCAVLDELYRDSRSHGPVWPQDGSMHNKDGSYRIMRLFRKLYPSFAVVDGTMEPGDILVCAPPQGGPGHAIVVGPRKNQLWHATATRVQRTGINLTGKVVRVLRAKERDSWI